MLRHMGRRLHGAFETSLQKVLEHLLAESQWVLSHTLKPYYSDYFEARGRAGTSWGLWPVSSQCPRLCEWPLEMVSSC